MQLDQKDSTLTVPLAKLQLHSRKCHHTYNATRQLPRALWIRSLRFGDSDFNAQLDLTKECKLFYEVILYYDHNRACTLYRTPEDFRLLKSGIGKLSRCHGGGGSVDLTTSAWEQTVVEDVEVLQHFLCEAISKKGKNCALEYFLRRRIDDCGGA